MSVANLCDACGFDDCKVHGADGQGTPLSWCPKCGTLMGFGTWIPLSKTYANRVEVLRQLAISAAQSVAPATDVEFEALDKLECAALALLREDGQ